MVRGPYYDRINGIKRGAWSSEEDDKLRAYVERYGHWNWRELPKFAGLSRCGKSCRLRWINYLQPNVRRGNYSVEEESLIIKLHEEHGNKWSLIAAQLPGRTDNEIKNYWHTHLKKRSNISDHNSSQTPESSQYDQASRNNNNADQTSTGTSAITPSNIILESSTLPPLMDTNVGTDRNLSSSSLEACDLEYKYSAESDFWTKPFVYDRTYFSADEGLLPPSCSYYDNDMNYYFSQ